MDTNRATRVYVKGTNSTLDAALARTLSAAFGQSAQVFIGDPGTAASGDIVVTTDGAASPTEVSELVVKGERVVVLAALPNAVAEASYRHAGARDYLPMIAAVAPLVASISVLMDAPQTASPRQHLRG